MRKLDIILTIVGALGMLWSFAVLLANVNNLLIDMVVGTGMMVFFGVLFLAGYLSLRKGKEK